MADVRPGAGAIVLLLGGARSGKSRRGQILAESMGPRRLYLATAEARDGEMTTRIAHHQAERGVGWTTIEEPLDLAGAIAAADPEPPLLVDCLTLWLSNMMERERDVPAAMTAALAAARARTGAVLFVSNELGFGLVPDNALGRAFRDAQGRLNQQVAQAADHVELVVAGLPLVLKAAS
ncbi:bifunctional adenosylcobinamide kinase/adenosylcobinamide-phosphate guanylyltransferase [Zavarzinia sp. CC-PAN008]|uniref:bifunctional adenosylcobinamide kinase/adenosylcobinamide-phosphate guanylyltransferase n=1 Tax=Zavarzinia sp. CC-PAN008 TaxID=3243332 RepID=UPI003F74A09A